MIDRDRLGPGRPSDPLRKAIELHRQGRDLDEAHQLLEETLARVAGDPAEMATTLLQLASNRRRVHKLGEAQRFARQALQLSTSPGDRAGRAAAHVELARIMLGEHNPTNAVDHLDMAARLCTPVDVRLTGQIEYAQAKIDRQRNDLPAARISLLRAIEAYGQAGDEYGEARSLALLGYYDRLAGDLTSARTHLHAALDLARDRFLRIAALAQLDMGQVCRLQNQYEEAVSRLHAAFESFWAIGDPYGIGGTYGAFSALYRRTGSMGLVQAAVNYARAAVAIAVDLDDKPAEALERRRLGESLRDAGRYELAKQAIVESLQLYQELPPRLEEIFALAALAKLVRIMEGPAKAFSLALEAQEKLDMIRQRFEQPSDQTLFVARHGWIYSVTLHCALETNNQTAAAEAAKLLREGAVGDAARNQLSRISGPTGSLIKEIAQIELGKDKQTATRNRRETDERLGQLYAKLRTKEPTIASALGRSFEKPKMLDRPGVHVLSVDFQEADGSVWTLWESADGNLSMETRTLTPQERRWLADLRASKRDALWDARVHRWRRLAEALLPAGLREALVAGTVSLLRLAPSTTLEAVPFGALRLETKTLDQLTQVVHTSIPRAAEGGNGPVSAGNLPPGGGGTPVVPRRSAPEVPKAVDVAPRTGVTDSTARAADTRPTPWLASLFPSQPSVARALNEDIVHLLSEEKLDLVQAVARAKSFHRIQCGPSCPPAHLSGLVVNGDPAGLLSRGPQRHLELVGWFRHARKLSWTAESPLPACVAYDVTLDELDVTFDHEATTVEFVEPVPDVEVVFDNTQLGRVVSISVRGGGLGRSSAWLASVSALLGPTLWAYYHSLAQTERGPARGPAHRVLLETDEWDRLRRLVWPALHQSVMPGAAPAPEAVNWWQPPAGAVCPPVVVMTTVTGWLPGVAWSEAPGANVLLPPPLAASWGVGEIGYLAPVHRRRLELRLDKQRDFALPTVTLSRPRSVPGTARMADDEVIITFEVDLMCGRRALTLVFESPPVT